MMFIMRGTTCSGKDTFIEQHFDNKNAIFSSDNFREMMCGNMSVQNFNKQVFEEIHRIVEFRLANRAAYTVYNATNLRFKDASIIVELCKKYHVPYIFISIVPPSLDILKDRNEIRHMNKGVPLIPEGVIEKHFDRYETCKETFIKEAMYGDLCKFIEIDQNYEVLRDF